MFGGLIFLKVEGAKRNKHDIGHKIKNMTNVMIQKLNKD
jgi:hypothetical protein